MCASVHACVHACKRTSMCACMQAYMHVCIRMRVRRVQHICVITCSTYVRTCDRPIPLCVCVELRLETDACIHAHAHAPLPLLDGIKLGLETKIIGEAEERSVAESTRPNLYIQPIGPTYIYNLSAQPIYTTYRPNLYVQPIGPTYRPNLSAKPIRTATCNTDAT